MTFLSEMDSLTGQIDPTSVREKGKELAEDYNAAAPFPHIVIDDFLPEPLIDRCIDELTRADTDNRTAFDRPQERAKRQYNPDQLTGPSRSLFYSFNSRPFLRLLENITGIQGLIPDPYFIGGGFHEIGNGGHLSVHADFNHHAIMDLERRINVLIYLNEDWREEFGGQLELWADDMTACVRSVVPVSNRCVIFNTTSTSNHGNPQPVRHPDGRTRKSIALYYYTATWDDSKRDHTTQFKVRPHSEDRPDWSVKRSEILRDFLPPVAWRAWSRLSRLARPGTHEDEAAGTGQ